MTISLAVWGRFPWTNVGPYIVAQLGGAFLAAAALLVLTLGMMLPACSVVLIQHPVGEPVSNEVGKQMEGWWVIHGEKDDEIQCVLVQSLKDGRIRVVIADDEPLALLRLSRCLEQAGCEVEPSIAATAATWAVYGLALKWNHDKNRPPVEEFAVQVFPLIRSILQLLPERA